MQLSPVSHSDRSVYLNYQVTTSEVMKTLVELSLILLVSSALGKDEVCKDATWGFEVCTQDGTLKRVIHTSRYLSADYFTLELRGDTIINSDVFSSLNLEVLRINLPDRKKEERFSLTLKPDSFSSLSNLKNLTISNAVIKFNGGNPLSPLRSLLDLQFQNCNFTEVPTEMLATVPNLDKLSLRGNQLTAVHPKDFAPLNHLRDLDLSRNGISNIEPGTFDGLNALRILELSDNAFPAAPGLFRGLSQLNKLRISEAFDHNGFQSHILQDVPRIEELQMGYNNLTTLSPGMFNAVPRLVELSFYRNKIRHIPTGVFEDLRSLKEISLAHNEIETISPGAFGYLELDDLIIILNRELKTIDTDTFKGLTVRRLTLSQNGIEELKPKAFNGLRVTQILDLNQNKLTEVKAEDFSGLRTKDLDLSQNRVGKIAQDAFKDTDIKRLGLFGTPIKDTDKAKWGLQDSVEIMK